MEYSLIICGGTFDRLHAGHKEFLRYAFARGEHVIIGVTSDAYVQTNKKNESILPFAQRERELQEFLSQEKLLERSTIVAIDSKFDQTQIPDSPSVALLVTPETKAAGEEINKERVKNGLSGLTLLLFPLVVGAGGEKISSSKIRAGIFDRDGILLPDKEFISTTLFLPDSLRKSLHQPFGMLFGNDIPKQFLKNPERIVTVGDVITKRMHGLQIQPKISVIDFAVERKKTNQSLGELGFVGTEKIVHIINPAGQLSPRIWKKLLQVVRNRDSKKNTVIIVEGEEDLFVIPLILILPLGSLVMYGQPSLSDQQKAGVVILEVTEQLKRQTLYALAQFVPN